MAKKPTTTGPLLEREGDSVVITTDGILALEASAAQGKRPNWIASYLGLSRKEWKSCLAAQPEALAAWERGDAAAEQFYVDGLRKAVSKGAFIPAIFALKSKYGYREGDPATDARPNITLVLPAAFSPADYLKMVEAAPPVPSLPPPEPEITAPDPEPVSNEVAFQLSLQNRPA